MNDDELSALVHREATRHRASEALRAAVRTHPAPMTRLTPRRVFAASAGLPWQQPLPAARSSHWC